MSRPEHLAPPDIFYNEEEAAKYNTSSRMQNIQKQLSERALELLVLPEGESCLVLDLGCGTGLSGDVLSEAGHAWIGFDISQAMLDVAMESEVEGDMFLRDLGHGLPVRPGVFDGAISISALQWLCQADKSEHVPKRRLMSLFRTCYASLRRGGRAVFQLYPESPAHVELITSCAMRCGFTGGMVVDFPNSTRAKKFYLCLIAGSSAVPMPKARGLEFDEDAVGAQFVKERQKRQMRGKRGKETVLEFIARKKEKQRKQGKLVARDSKYTGRKRRTRF